MKFSLIWKIGVGTTVFSGGIATIVVLSTQNEQGETNVNDSLSSSTKVVDKVSIFVFSKDISHTTTATTNSDFDNNYQCSIENQTFDCTISEAKINKTLKHSNISELIQDSDTQETLNKEQLKQFGNIYKISIDKSYLIKHPQLIEKHTLFDLVRKTASSGEETQRFAWFNVLFAIDGQKLHENYVTKVFIFKADKSLDLQTQSSYKCSITGTVINEEKCYVYDFGTEKTSDKTKQDLEIWTFNTPTALEDERVAKSSSIQQNKYYWMYFTSSIEDLKLSAAKTISKISIKNSIDVSQEYFVTPALDFVSQDKNKDHLFILK